MASGLALGGPPSVPAALVVAHPGHELRVHHWVERARPLVFVLTHGDGSQGVSRLGSTTRVLERAGARIGAVYGHWSDRDLYQALVEGRHDEFLRVARAIGDALHEAGIGLVVADAEERYNPAHDVCRYLTAAACERLARRGVAVRELEFPLAGPPDALMSGTAPPESSIVVHLDDAALARKLDAARGYPEMADEVSRALAAFGESAFARECLTPARVSPMACGTRPFYERHGEARVASGAYRDVIRYDTHLRPLRERLSAPDQAVGA